MFYESQNLSEKENSFVKFALEQSAELKCTAIAQIFTTDQFMKQQWTHITTGVLYLAESHTNVFSMGLFHLLRQMTEWEEEVYEEMTLKYEKDRILTLEGKKRVFLLNFLCDDECRSFQNIFSQLCAKRAFETTDNDSEYEELTDGPENEYETIMLPPSPKKIEKKSKKLQMFLFWTKKDEKKKKEHEKKKLSISAPKTETFEHKAHAALDSSGLVIEGVDIDVVQSLIKKAGISQKLYKKNKEFIDEFVDIHKNKIKKEHYERLSAVKMTEKETQLKRSTSFNNQSKRYITRSPSDTNLQKRAVENCEIVPLKPNIKPKPKILAKPALKPKPTLLRKLPVIEEVQKVPSSKNSEEIPCNDLLAAIRNGHKLKPVAFRQTSQIPPRQDSQEMGIADALRLAITARSPAFNGNEEKEEQTYFATDAWE